MKINILLALALFVMAGCTSKSTRETKAAPPAVPLPAPDVSHQVKKFSRVVGWPSGQTPTAPEGFAVKKFADGLKNPRWAYVLPNGDVLVAEASSEFKSPKEKKDAEKSGKTKSQNLGNSANRLTLLRDANKDGTPEVRHVFLEKIKQPLGMLLIGNSFYVAATDGLWKYSYRHGQDRLTGKGKKILDLPAGGYNNHWTRNLIANAEGSKIYISVGSASNVGEHGMKEEERRANILEVNPDGKGERIFAAGLRNPVGMDWAPGTNTLWTVVNERDNLGDDLVPDYLTSVKEGGFYGWPYSYFGANEDPRLAGERPDLVKKSIVPEVQLGSHTASLGLTFYRAPLFPEKYRGGAFIGQHGSWNRSQISGYKVVFVPFKNGKPAGPPEDFLTGFVKDPATAEVYGRPVGVTEYNGGLLVMDDSSNTIWQVRAK